MRRCRCLGGCRIDGFLVGGHLGASSGFLRHWGHVDVIIVPGGRLPVGAVGGVGGVGIGIGGLLSARIRGIVAVFLVARVIVGLIVLAGAPTRAREATTMQLTMVLMLVGSVDSIRLLLINHNI